MAVVSGQWSVVSSQLLSFAFGLWPWSFELCTLIVFEPEDLTRTAPSSKSKLKDQRTKNKGQRQQLTTDY
jgi:hypothetical protein